MKIAVPDYTEKSDDELLNLALDSNSLTTEAQDALQTELKNRNLNSPTRLAKFADERKYLDFADEIRRLGLSVRGNGRRAYGKSNLEVSGTNEEYDATIFVVVSYFPLIPTGTYRFSREQGTKHFRILEKKPLSLAQVVWVWTKAVAVIAAIPFAIDIIDKLSRGVK